MYLSDVGRQFTRFIVKEGYKSVGYQIKPDSPAPGIFIKEFTIKSTGRLSEKKTAIVRFTIAYAEHSLIALRKQLVVKPFRIFIQRFI